MASSISALSAYRRLLRATRIAFQGMSIRLAESTHPHIFQPLIAYDNMNIDDLHMLWAARAEARKRFDENRRLGVDTPMQIRHAVETADILRHNIVQGVRDADREDGKWSMFPSSC
jgi:complex III assembly factor LYRM7